MNRYSNTAFIPYTPAEPQTSDHMFNVGGAMSAHQDTLSASATLTPETHQPTAWEIKRSNQLRNDYFNGLYNWANAHRDPSCAAEAKRIFGDNLCPADKEEAALYLGQSLLDATGHTQDPAGYYRAIGKELPTGYADYATLLRRIGQDFIKDQQSLYDTQQKKLEEARKDLEASFNRLPEAIANSVLEADGITAHASLDKDLLQSLTKYNQGENALASQKRAELAWQYIAPAFQDVDKLQSTNRNLLLDVANALSDEKGQLDPHALAAFVMLTDKKATELQSTNSEFWADFADKFQNFWRTTRDQSLKTGIGSAFAASTLPELQPTWGQQYQPPAYYGDERVEKLYGYMNQAINTAISPSEKAEWYAKLLSEMGGMLGEFIVPMGAGIAAGAALAPAGAFAAAVAGYGAGVAASAPSTINNAIGNAYIKGVVNPELYGTLEGIGQAAAENIGGPATSLKLFSKAAGKLTNYAASRAAGSRFLANQYARTTLNYLTAGAFESVTELAEEEIGGYIGSRLNAMARYMGAEVSPQAYELGESLKGMKDYEVAAIFGYSYALGFFGIPANYRAARTFAKNTDNLLKAGHTAKTARDIQLQAFKTEDRIAEIQADEALSPEQKKAAILKEEQNFAEYQKNKFTSDALSNPNLRARLEKEGRVLREETEVALDVEHEADIQILKEHNILEAVVVPGQKYRVSFYEEGEEQADGTRAPGKVVTQEWTRMQLTNWLMLQKDTRIEQDLRSFNALLLAHAHAQSASVEETKARFQNLGANRPLAALGELHKNGMTPGFFQKAAQAALQLQLQHQAAGMTEQEAAQQPSPDFEGLSLGEVQTLATGAAERKEQEAATTGALQNITDDSNVEYGGLNLLARDGTALIKYVAGKANILDMLEEKFEADIKQRTRGNKTLYNQLAETLLHIQAHLPGNIQLLDPKKKGNYTKADFVEAYSKIATGAFLYNEKNLPINAAGHRLIQNIGRAVDNTRMFQLIGNAWLNYANSPEGKAHLEAGGQTIADIMQEAGFTFSRQLADARATAEQRAEVLEARQWQPAIEEELDALLEEAEEEETLAEINEKEAKEPITIPADQSITGKEITVEPQQEESIVNSHSSIVNPSDPAANLRNLIQQGKAKTQDFARFFRDYPAITDAEATEQGIRPLTQKGNPAAAYTQGRLIAAKLTPQQFDDYLNGKLKGKALKQALSKPGTSVPTNFSIKVSKETIQKATANQLKSKERIDLCSLPRVLAALGETAPGIYTRAETLHKLANKHKLSDDEILETIESLDDPLLVIKESRDSYIFYLPLEARNKAGNLAPVMAALRMQRDDTSGHYLMSAYPLKSTQKIEEEIGRGHLVYSKYNKAALSNSNAPSPFKPDLMRLLVNRGFTDNVITEEDIVNYNFATRGIFDSFTALDADDILFTDGVLEAQNAIVTKPNVNFSIKALHASPHNFRKFSTEKMGTGEGAQAYGWGLYFAEDEGVNKKYFNDFSIKRDTYLFDGKPMSRADIVSLFADIFEQIDKEYNAPKSAKDIAHTILWKLRDTQGGIKGAYSRQPALIEKRKKQQERNTFGVTNNLIKSSLAAHDVLKLLAEHDIQTHPATNYRVEINADDTNLLMWDERYSGQEIKDLLGEELFEQIYDEGDEEATLLDNGEGIYMLLRSVFGSKEAASKKLQEHGVKGIKYLDGNSRSAGEGTYNYVIFSGDDIKITAVNESGTWSMEEGWEEYDDPTANFSIRAANPSTLDRFTADPLGERIVHTVRTEARRYARVLGDKTPQEQAMNAIASAESIIMAVDKYLHRPDKPVSRRHRDQLTKLRSIIEKYAQIIASGTPRSFKRISPAEQQELQAAIAELEAAELETAETDPALLIEDDKRMNKRTREARSREHHRAIVREAAKGRVYATLSSMLDATADALDDYLKDQLLTKLDKLTATVKIKRTTGKRLKGKMTADMYRELEQAIQLMGYSARQKEDAVESILAAHETLAEAINKNEVNLTKGNALLIELAHQLEQEGTPVTAQNLTAALASHEARVAIFADIESKNYEQTRTAANAIYHIIRYGRALWQQKHDAREENIQQYLRYFLANTTAQQGKANAIKEQYDKFSWKDALSLNATMNTAQLLLALESYEPLRPIMQKVLENYAVASVARQKHMQEMRKQELYIYGRILGIKPATAAGYSEKQLREISDKFDDFYAENNKTQDTGITVTWQERNADGVLETYTSDPLRLTKWEALNLILSYRQADYQTNAQIHGYTDEVLTKLEKFIGSDLMDFGNGIQQALVNDGTIPVYEEREGIPMRANQLYWPGNININTINTTREEPLVNPYHPAAGHDFLHTRVRHRNEISHANAFTVWRTAVADRANYVYADPVTTELESLLARQQFAGRLKTLIGEGLFRQLKAAIAEIKNAAWQETTLQDVNNTLVATAFASRSLAVLSGNPGSLMRQLSAVANAGLMPGLTPGKFLQYAIGLKQGEGHIGITDILKLDSFTSRERDNSYVNEMLAMGNNVKFSRLMDWAKAGMNAMDKLDLLANAFSAAVVYNHKYDQLKSLGTLTEDQIKKQCENAVAVYTKLLAQPLNRTDKSALYWQLGNHALGRAVLFMSSESINKIGMLRANYIRLRNEGKNPAVALGSILGTMGITVGLTAAITEAALALLTGSLPDDDDNIAAWATALWLNASYGQYLGSLPLIGGVSDSIFSPYGGYFSGDFRLPGIDTFRYGSKLVQMLTDNKTYTAAQWEKETTRFMRDFTAVLGYAGGAYSRWQTYSHFAAYCHSLTAALNALYPIARSAEAYSDPIPNGKRKPRRSKSRIEKWLTPETKKNKKQN